LIVVVGLESFARIRHRAADETNAALVAAVGEFEAVVDLDAAGRV